VVEATHKLIGSHVEIVSLRPARLRDVWHDIEQVGEATDCSANASRVVRELRSRMAELEARTRRLPRPRLLCLEWLDPLMIAGNWVPELAEIAGATSALAEAGRHSAWTNWNELAESSPDAVCLMPCGFTIADTERELAMLWERAEWRSLPAVRSGRVFVVNGSAYFNRPGPRLVESAGILAAIVHPDECAEMMV